MNPDPWLERWLPLVSRKVGAGPVFEIGCGNGDDTSALAAAGFDVVALDLSKSAVAQARLRVPQARIECQDVRAPFPVGESGTGVVIASLSLHYFSWIETLSIVSRIGVTLRPGGVLICRLNSTEDHNYGASGHDEIEADYYRVNGEAKRFFNRQAIDSLFAVGWSLLSVEHYATDKYSMPKAVWEIVAEKYLNKRLPE